MTQSMEFPCTITRIESTMMDILKYPLIGKVGDLVAVRPCSEEFNRKVFLGILIGDMVTGVGVSQNSETGALALYEDGHDTVIVVPELGRTIYGTQSYWKPIKTMEDLGLISDCDINSPWYVLAVKMLSPGIATPPATPVQTTASMLDGSAYPLEIDEGLLATMNQAGIVAAHFVFGEGEGMGLAGGKDRVVFSGAISGEASIVGDEPVYVDRNGILPSGEQDEVEERKASAASVICVGDVAADVLGEKERVRSLGVDIPHDVFHSIGEKVAFRGIVFSLDDIGSVKEMEADEVGS